MTADNHAPEPAPPKASPTEDSTVLWVRHEILRLTIEHNLFRKPGTLHLLRRRPTLKEKLLRGDIAISPQDRLNVVADIERKLAVITI